MEKYDTAELRQQHKAATPGCGRGFTLNQLAVWDKVPALLDAFDAQAATLRDRDAEIERIKANNAHLIAEKAELSDMYQAHEEEFVKQTAELAALRERCAAAEADMAEAGQLACDVNASIDERVICFFCSRGEDCMGDGFQWRGPQPAEDMSGGTSPSGREGQG